MKNLHLEHLEDLLFKQGSVLPVSAWLTDLKDYILFRNETNVKLSIKWDGSPAFVCGKHPETGLFFIGTKSVFNKREPKIYVCREDIMKILDVGLRHKLMVLFEAFKDVPWEEVVQGDLLWTTDSTKLRQLGIGWYATFQPNTLIYALDATRQENIGMFRRSCGVAIHTTYQGSKLSEMDASFGFNTQKYQMPNVIQFETDYRMMESFSQHEYRQGDLLDLKTFQYAIHRIQNFEYNQDLLGFINSTPNVLDSVMLYINSCVRRQQQITGPGFLIEYRLDHLIKIESLKKVKAKSHWNEEHNKVFSYSATDWSNLFILHQLITEFKNGIIDRLNQSQRIEIFVEDNHIQPANHEGFVAYNNRSAVKLVNRSDFSRINMLREKSWNVTTQPQS
jgi:Family of unknown function (DUF6267)